MGIVFPPTLLNSSHDYTLFDCGNGTLNEWLKKRALKNQESGASHTFVISMDNRVIGYYALATGGIDRLTTPGAIARNMPQPLPVIVLGRLAVDIKHQGHRLGVALLKDAMLRTRNLSRIVGIRAMLVHAISDEARRFYESHGFQMSPIGPMTLFLSMKHLEAHL